MPDPHDLAKTYYNAARAEIVQRLALREQVLLAGVTTYGVIAGLALKNTAPDGDLLALLPLLSFGFTFVFFRHQWVMSAIADYIHEGLSPYLGIGKAEGPQEPPVPMHWDACNKDSREPRLRLGRILVVELTVAWLLLWCPGVAGLILFLVFKGAFQAHQPSSFWIEVGALSIFLAAGLAEFAKRAVHLARRWRYWSSIEGET
jgi:hypothetical protein